jgi:hypothetical protein
MHATPAGGAARLAHLATTVGSARYQEGFTALAAAHAHGGIEALQAACLDAGQSLPPVAGWNLCGGRGVAVEFAPAAASHSSGNTNNNSSSSSGSSGSSNGAAADAEDHGAWELALWFRFGDAGAEDELHVPLRHPRGARFVAVYLCEIDNRVDAAADPHELPNVDVTFVSFEGHVLSAATPEEP